MGVKTTCRVTSSKKLKNESTKITKFHNMWSHLRRSGSRISGQKAILGQRNKENWKIRSKLWVSKLHVVLQFPKIRKKWSQKSPNFMIFGPIACFRRSGSRFSGQKGFRSSEMRVYIGNTRHIKNHQNFKILFWSRESKQQMFTNFPDFFTKKWSGNLGITSETTWESRVRRRW